MHSDMIGHLGPVLSSPAGSHTLPPSGTGWNGYGAAVASPPNSICAARFTSGALGRGHAMDGRRLRAGRFSFFRGAPARAHARRLFRPRTDAAFPGRSRVFFSPPLPFSVDELMRRVRLGENGWGRLQLAGSPLRYRIGGGEHASFGEGGCLPVW